jgi:hypothetical protein
VDTTWTAKRTNSRTVREVSPPYRSRQSPKKSSGLSENLD